MRILICGDTHGTLDTRKLYDYFIESDIAFSKEDYLIICGDVGVCGFNRFDEADTREFLQSLPVTILFCDGNRENFEHLNSYPIDEWNGGKVHFIENDIIHLMRGQIFNIDGIKFFTFGGAYSIDRSYGSKGVTWFPEEMPTTAEYEEGCSNLEKSDYQVDYIISHTAPREVVSSLGYGEFSDGEVTLRQYLQKIADTTMFTAWYFGHFHIDEEIDSIFFCLYDEIIEVNF